MTTSFDLLTTKKGTGRQISKLTSIAFRRDKAVFEEHVPGLVYRAASKAHYLLPGTDIEDLVQHCILYIWRKRRLHRSSKATVSTWVTMMASARLIDLARANGRERAKLERFARKLQMEGVIPQV